VTRAGRDGKHPLKRGASPDAAGRYPLVMLLRCALALLMLPLVQQGGAQRPPRVTADDLKEKVDAGADDWKVELLNDAADGQLKLLTKALVSHAPASLERLASDEFRCGRLRPDELETVSSGTTEVLRGVPEPLTTYRGPEGLTRALTDLTRFLGATGERRAKLKLFRLEAADDSFRTDIYYQASCGPVQQSATWRCEWRSPFEDTPPLLLSIEVKTFEEVTSRLHFTDVAPSVLGHLPHYREQVLRGIGHWAERISTLEGMNLYGHHGLAVGDVNGDGLEDLYVCDAGGLPNRLYVQRADGTVDDRSAQAGVDWLEPSTGALLVDLDDDGDQDLVVASWPEVLFAENDGQGAFELRARSGAVTDPFSLAAADPDGDGDLDVYVTGYTAAASLQDRDADVAGGPFPYHDANNGGRNALLRNEGDFLFLDATHELGLDANNSRFSLAAAWEDFDDDGDQDLYVANDFGRNNLYRNDGETFVDVAPELGVEDGASGMSVDWADYDGDGAMDLYVGNMFSAAGNRVTYQRRFEKRAMDATEALRRMARGNTLFRGARGGPFDDVSEPSRAFQGRWAWSSVFADLDDDRRPDLVVANGYITNEDPGDL
jgi:hypothetical protein